MRNVYYIIGMVASICVAIAGQAEIIPEPYRHYIAIAGIIGAALNGYMVQHQPPETT